MQDSYDVVIVGGGAAGLSAAMTLGRSRRSVLVVDAGAPRNAPASAVHNYLAREGIPPAELTRLGREEVARYGSEVVAGTVTAARPVGGQARLGFEVTLADGQTVGARRLLVTTGLVDELPDLPGVAERWGRDVLHCPYCHGYEVRDSAIGVLLTGPMGVHQALLFRQLSEDIIVFRHTWPSLGDEEREQLDARGVRVVDGEVAALDVTDDRLTGVRLRSGGVLARSAVVVAPHFAARADVLTSLGLDTTELQVGGHSLGRFVPTDPTGLTAVPGVYAAGNVTTLQAQVTGAAAAGLSAAAQLNADLAAEDTRLAVAAARARRTPEPAGAR